MGCNGTVGLSAGRRVAGGDSFSLRPHPELEFTLYAPATSGAQGGQDAAGRRLISLLMQTTAATNKRMFRSKETLQEAFLNKRKEPYSPGPTERRDKTTIAQP